MKKLTNKGKHTVWVGNYSHTNTSKPTILRRGNTAAGYGKCICN